MKLLRSRTGVYSYDKAVQIASALQSGDADWTYTVVEVQNDKIGRAGRIDVTDEDGEVVVSGIMMD